MWLLEWLSRQPMPLPRSHDEIRRELERREAHPIRRLNAVEESLLSLTAEAGLEDLRRRLERVRDDA